MPIQVWPAALMGLLLLAGAVVLYSFNPTQSRFYPFCQFHQTTGLLCPGCGSLRALHHLLHGRFVESLHCNVLLVISLPAAGVWALQILRRRVQGKSIQVRAAWLWTGLVLVLVFGLLRNLPFARMAWLAP